MADKNSGSVAIVAIIAIVILVVGAVYFLNGGSFNFNKSADTNAVTTTDAPSGASTSATTENGKN